MTAFSNDDKPNEVGLRINHFKFSSSFGFKTQMSNDGNCKGKSSKSRAHPSENNKNLESPGDQIHKTKH